MKNLITILILFVATGCSKSKSLTEEDVFGSYEAKIGVHSHKFVFLENGKAEYHSVGVKEESEWKIVGKEVHVRHGQAVAAAIDLDDFISVWKIVPNGNLTNIAEIEDGKRTDLSKEKQSTFKKIK